MRKLNVTSFCLDSLGSGHGTFYHNSSEIIHLFCSIHEGSDCIVEFRDDFFRRPMPRFANSVG